MAWLWAAKSPAHSSARPGWWAVGCLIEPISSGTFLLRFQRYLVPIARQYQVNKFSTICVLALGAFVASATGGVDPSAWPEKDRDSVRGACLLGFVLFLSLKFLVCDVDVVALSDHAVRVVVFNIKCSLSRQRHFVAYTCVH